MPRNQIVTEPGLGKPGVGGGGAMELLLSEQAVNLTLANTGGVLRYATTINVVDASHARVGWNLYLLSLGPNNTTINPVVTAIDGNVITFSPAMRRTGRNITEVVTSPLMCHNTTSSTINIGAGRNFLDVSYWGRIYTYYSTPSHANRGRGKFFGTPNKAGWYEVINNQGWFTGSVTVGDNEHVVGALFRNNTTAANFYALIYNQTTGDLTLLLNPGASATSNYTAVMEQIVIGGY